MRHRRRRPVAVPRYGRPPGGFRPLLRRVAVAQAAARRQRFLGAAADRAVFRVADLEHTGLPADCAHGVVCVDALGRAGDRRAALRELGRILAPDGRLLVTRALRDGPRPAWHAHLAAAGLREEHVDERPGEPGMWERLYRLWIAHADQLRAELGPGPAARMLQEAHRMLPTVPGRRAVLLTLRRPPTGPAGPDPAATMSAPDEPGARTAAPERTFP
ncbi:class I SAM-dependent methyltransferase [Streptomyces kanasensis]|uniref:class I SAM-dependent methyltransferase n=1 Tax=Streptomyces kanasensis TaxID=936756 RepID=UPI00380EA924